MVCDPQVFLEVLLVLGVVMSAMREECCFLHPLSLHNSVFLIPLLSTKESSILPDVDLIMASTPQELCG